MAVSVLYEIALRRANSQDWTGRFGNNLFCGRTPQSARQSLSSVRDDCHEVYVEVAHGARNLRRRVALYGDRINLKPIQKVICEYVLNIKAQLSEPTLIRLLLKNALRQRQQVCGHTALLNTEEHHSPATLARKRRRILQSRARVLRKIRREQNILKRKHRVKQESESRIQKSE